MGARASLMTDPSPQVQTDRNRPSAPAECPDDESLGFPVAGVLEESRLAVLEGPVESCERCQNPRLRVSLRTRSRRDGNRLRCDPIAILPLRCH